MVTKCAVHDNNVPCELCRTGVKCTVENCPNMTHEGEFIHSICAPCWEFLGHGRGVTSQAYRNSREKFIQSYVIAYVGAFMRADGPIDAETRRNIMSEAWRDAAETWTFRFQGYHFGTAEPVVLNRPKSEG